MQLSLPAACIFMSISEESELDVNRTTAAVRGRSQPDGPDHVNDLSSGTLDTAVLIVINSPGDEIVEY